MCNEEKKYKLFSFFLFISLGGDIYTYTYFEEVRIETQIIKIRTRSNSQNKVATKLTKIIIKHLIFKIHSLHFEFPPQNNTLIIVWHIYNDFI